MALSLALCGAAMAQDGAEITEEIMATMTQWIIGHIGEEDLEYAQFLKNPETSEPVPA